ncbi:hypothetical protein V8E53_000059, partial [Lactarius tabidus]
SAPAKMGKWRERDRDRNLVIKTPSEKADGMQCSDGFSANWQRYDTVFRLEELAEILAFDFDEEHAVFSMCSSLITLVNDGESQVVQFSHFSVNEFLTSSRLQGTTLAAGDISFHRIAQAPAHTVLSQPSSNLRANFHLRYIPLVNAAENWVDQSNFGKVSLRIKDGVDNLFDIEKPRFSRWIRIHDLDDSCFGLPYGETRPERPEATPIYHAALYGLSEVVEELICKRLAQVNARSGTIGTALHAAPRMNHLNRTPPHVATEMENVEFVRWLLDHDGDVNAKADDD